MLIVEDHINLPVLKESGIDSAEHCKNKKHFLNYTKEISYRYNSKGFRDHEWPADMDNVIWCLGDSFTVGIGQPFQETWPQVLEQKAKIRCINLGENGCSNDTLCLRLKHLVKTHNPKNVVIMWSYFSRRRINGIDVHYDRKDFGDEKDLENFAENFIAVDKIKSDIIHLIIPFAFIGDIKIFESLICKKFKFITKEQFDKIIHFKQLDYARDYHHFDIKTSQLISNLILKKQTNKEKKC